MPNFNLLKSVFLYNRKEEILLFNKRIDAKQISNIFFNLNKVMVPTDIPI